MSDFSEQTKGIWAEVKANQAKRKQCKRHRILPEDWAFGRRITCRECGAWMQATDLIYYIEGYEAAGGNADDIWPGYRQEQK